MKLNFVWKNQTEKYSNSEDLYLNKIYLGSVSWNSCMSKDDPDKESKRYIGSSVLYKSRWYGSTSEVVKGIVEKHITAWFIEALK